MSSTIALTRLLTLNNLVYDLGHQLDRAELQMFGADGEVRVAPMVAGQIAALQDEMDRETRASLATCWLGIPFGKEE